jgi:hypothetical protein
MSLDVLPFVPDKGAAVGEVPTVSTQNALERLRTHLDG